TGATLGQLGTSFDGTYTTTMTYSAGAQPTLSLVVRGVPIFQNQPVAPIDQLHYVDQVLDFDLGLEGAPGANQHKDPDAALGDITNKPENVFTSLGGYGSLAVGFHNQLVLAQGDDDITVFVHPDDDLRSYRLEARQAATTGNWVPLGHSVGST